ncbi:MAG: hypothetical protein EZS28_039773, partial [Streblomastix strix]
RFSRVLELPTATYLREFLQSQNISMCKGNDITSEKKLTLYASNIKDQNNKIYTSDIAKGIRPRCFVNMDETEINAENDAFVAKIRGLKRSPPAEQENSSGHITYVMSIANGPHQPPQMYIVSGLKKVPQSLQVLMEEEEIYIFINDSGFRTCRLFREYAKLQLTCFILGYFTPNERIILLLDRHPSRKDWKAA